jgi:MFS family permease
MDKIEKYVLLASFITSFSTLFLLNGSSLATPSIGREFLMSNVTQNWIITIVSIFISATTIPAGQICSKYGCKKIFVIGGIIFLAGLISCCFSLSSYMFLASCAIMGIGYSLYLVAETAIIVLAIDKENRGKSFGIVIVGSYLGCIAAPLLGGYLINNFGWRTLYYLVMPLVVLCIFITLTKIDTEWVTNANDKMDKIGSLLYVVGIMLFIYGFSDLLSFVGKASVIMGVIVLILFGIYEYKTELPVFKIRLFENKTFAAYNLTGFFEFFAIAVFDVMFNYYFQYAKGWDPQLTGSILIISPILLALISPLSGRLSDRIHPQKIATTGLCVMLIAIVSIIFLRVNTPLYFVAGAMALIAIGTALFSVPNTNAVMSSIDEEHAPYASATQLTLRSCGQTLSYGLLTLICSFVMGALPLSTEYAGLFVNSVNIIAMICTVLCLIAIVFSIRGIRSQKAIS